MRRNAAWICTILLAGLAVALPAHAGSVTVAPSAAKLAPLGTQQYTATVDGTASAAVTWMVNGIPGGAPMLGTISATGLYTAPADVPAPLKVAIEAEDRAAPLSNGSASIRVSASGNSGPTFFVAPSGSDSNAGTAAAPWLTIQHAAETVPAGGTVLVASGTYNELVTVTRSGNATAGFITIAAAPGATPIVDGTGLTIPNGENGLITLNNASFVRIVGFEVQNYTSNSAALDPVGIYVVGAGNWIELLDNHVHNIVTTVKTSNGDALGIAIYGTRAPQALTNVVIDGNELDDLVTGFSELLALSGNVQNFQVTGNLIHDNNNIGIDIAGYEHVSPEPAFDRASFGYVAGNTVFNISSLHNPAYQGQASADGIYVDGGTNIVIERNLVHNTDIGIEAASEHQVDHQPVFSNAVTIRSNVVYASSVVGITIGGYANNVGGTQNWTIANNTLVGDGTSAKQGTGELHIQFHASGNVFYNNIAVSASKQDTLLYSFVKLPNPPALLDYDLYDGPLGSANSQWTWVGKTYTGFAKCAAKTPNDHHGLFADPDFVDPSAHNYQLGAGSPAIGVGLLLPLSQAGLFDFQGNPRITDGIDLGAFQN